MGVDPDRVLYFIAGAALSTSVGVWLLLLLQIGRLLHVRAC